MPSKAVPKKVEIAVIDDHPIFREGVVRVLNAEPGFSVVAEGASAEDAVRIAQSARPDVMLLDINMPGGGLEAARAVSTEAPNTHLVILTVVAEESFVLSALGAGARGYVLKGISGAELVRTLWALQEGEADECFINSGIGDHMFSLSTDHRREAPTVVSHRLSSVDREILSLTTVGYSYAAIAQAMGLHARLVEDRIAHVEHLVKLGPDVLGRVGRGKSKRALH